MFVRTKRLRSTPSRNAFKVKGILGASPEALKSQMEQNGFKVEASFEVLDPLGINRLQKKLFWSHFLFSL
jgi:hypothetical protein